jgi:hypothetical protein
MNQGIIMRLWKSLCVFAGLAVCLVATALVAQGAGLAGITGESYTATFKITRVQTLADGTKITHESMVKEARDSAGKIYRETHQELPVGAGGGNVVNVFVFDPVNRTEIIWNTRVKQASIFHIRAPQQIRSNCVAAPKVQTTVQPSKTAPDPAPQVEDLGTQTINGVVAAGTRITRVITAGKDGNDQPIIITFETWRSPESGLVVRRIQDDPRSGLTTTELTDIQQGEPDPTLFQVPEGYTVKERLPQQNQN